MPFDEFQENVSEKYYKKQQSYFDERGSIM